MLKGCVSLSIYGMIYKRALGASDSNGEKSTILSLEARSGEGGVGDAGLGLGRGSGSGLGRGSGMVFLLTLFRSNLRYLLMLFKD